MGRRAASVLPEPVGATIRTFSPPKILGIAVFCGGVGCSIPLSRTASLTSFERRVKAEAGADKMSTLSFGLELLKELLDPSKLLTSL